MKECSFTRIMAMVLLLIGAAPVWSQHNGVASSLDSPHSEKQNTDAHSSTNSQSKQVNSLSDVRVHNADRHSTSEVFSGEPNEISSNRTVKRDGCGNEELRVAEPSYGQLADVDEGKDNFNSRQNYVSNGQVKNEQSNVDYGSPVDENSPVWPSVLAVIALTLAAYCLFLNKDKIAGGKNGKKKADVMSDDMFAIRQSVSAIDNEMVRMKREMNRLNTTIADLSSRISSLSQQPGQPSTDAHVSEINHKPVATSIVTSYATQVTSEGFPLLGVSQNNSEFVIAILSLKGSHGTYVVNNRPSSQNWLLENFSYTVSPICKLVDKVSNPNAIVTSKPGIVDLVDDMWHISKLAEVNLV